MIISEQWLREWVSVDLSAQQIADCLTNAGLEVDGIQALPGKIENLVVGKVLEVSKHPDADRLNLTKVDIGGAQLDIVCGAANVAENLLVAVATQGAKLPNGLKIKRAKVRGIESNGMLCSASELGLEADSDGIMELGDDAKVGQRVDDYLGLDDQLIDIDLTPNRGDCLSVQGIARELKFLADGEFIGQLVSSVDATVDQKIEINLQNEAACPRYLGRVVKGINPAAQTPIWMAERLRRSGVRPISPVVDITNYVMLELGQPMHAFDHNKLSGGICVRMAIAGEQIKLLDDSMATLDEETLVIADESHAIAIAGVMGGADSAIDHTSTTIVLEAAHFTRKSAAGCARRYGLHTESSHRFERGVDPQLPSKAIERATELVLQICGGQPGPVCEESSDENLFVADEVELRLARLEQLLGMELARGEVSRVLQRIAAEVQDTTTGWRVTPPSYRFDIEYEADLVEEVARVRGYDSIPTALPRIAPRSIVGSEVRISPRTVRQTLVARDFREVITYSFIAPEAQADLSREKPVTLANPLAENMSVMRTSLLPGILQAAQFNHNRQHGRIRIFEVGATYHRVSANHGLTADDNQLTQVGDKASSASGKNNPEFKEVSRLAGLITGPKHAAQWGISGANNADWYDLKADLEAVLSLTGSKEPFIFNEFEHFSMHPGQVSQISVRDLGSTDENVASGLRGLGVLARLHPTLEQKFGFSAPVFVFEIDLQQAMLAELPAYQGVSRFPSIRRDLSLLVGSDLPVAKLLECAHTSVGSVLKQVNVFDVYQGEGVPDGQKSVSFSLTLQNSERTLTDEEAESLTQQVLSSMQTEFDAELRS